MKKIRDFLNKKRKGMTLIELMIVVVIIGIVFAYAFVNAGANTEKAKQARTAEDIAAITSAAAMYVAEQPDASTAIAAIDADNTILNNRLSKPIEDMVDGWGAAYTVEVDGTDPLVLVIDCGSTATKNDLDGNKFTRVLNFN